MELSALNDDCVHSIFAYLPSDQLFAVRFSETLKKRQFYACASDVLLKQRAPFWIKPEFSGSGQLSARNTPLASRAYKVWLKDAQGISLAEIKRPIFFGQTPLSEKVCEVEQALDLFRGDSAETGFWFDLLSQLKTVSAIVVRLHNKQQNSECTHATMVVRMDALAGALRPLMATIRSFALFGKMLLSDVQMRLFQQIICDMPNLSSLTIPTYYLRFIASNGHLRRVNPVNELFLYVNHSNMGDSPSCPEALDLIGPAGFGSISHLSFDCRSSECHGCEFYKHDCVGSFGALQKLSLQKLTWDISGDIARLERAVDRISVPELHVTLRRSPRNSLGVLFKQFNHFSNVCLSIQDFPERESIIQLVRPIFNHPCFASDLREFKITSWSTAVTLPSGLGPYAILCPGLDLPEWLKLRSVDLSALPFDLHGHASNLPHYPMGFGVRQFGPIVKALLSNPCLSNAKLNARIDSISALKSQLPPDCAICNLIETPRVKLAANFVLHPDIYWQPVRMVIVCERQAWTGGFVDCFAEKLFLRLVNPKLSYRSNSEFEHI